MGKVGLLSILIGITFVATLGITANDAFAGTTQWKSDITVGILESEYFKSNLELYITTHSNDALRIEWNAPNIPRDEILMGYEILRKTADSDYIILVPNTNSLETSYIDAKLQRGYYGYQVNAITKPYDDVPLHGIDRIHPLFPQYLEDQELIAKEIMMQLYPDYFDPPFEEINNIFRYELADTKNLH